MNGSPAVSLAQDAERMDWGRGESKDFPVIQLDDALEIARRVKDLGNSADMSAMERVLGIRGGALARKLASARRWGLIEGKGQLRLTNLAKEIFFYVNDEQPAAAKIRAFLGVPMFRELYEMSSREGSLPRDDMLRNLIIAKYRLDERDASTVTNIIKRSVATFVPLLKPTSPILPKPAAAEPKPFPTAPVQPTSQTGQQAPANGRMLFDAARCLGRMEEMARKSELIRPTKDELNAVLTDMLDVSAGFGRLNQLLKITKEELKSGDIDVLTALKRLKFFSQSLEEDCNLTRPE